MITMTRTRLRPEVKEKWLAALRSDDYRQGKSYLHLIEDGEHRFCCIGVLCDLAEKDGALVARSSGDAVTYDSAISLPPAALDEWAFAGDSNLSPWSVSATAEEAEDAGGSAEIPLIDLNDVVGLSFAEIADRIEADL